MPLNQNSKHLNEEHKLPVGCWFVSLLVVLFALMSSYRQTSAPFYTDTYVSQCDGVSFDNIRMNLALGEGFDLDFSDSMSFQNAAFAPANGKVMAANWMFSLDVDGETANHFPAVPYLMLVGQTASSDSRYFVAFLGTLLLAFALAILINQVRSMFGVLPAVLATLTLLTDSLLQQSPILITGDAIMAGLLILPVVVFLQAISPFGGTASARSGTQLPRSIWKWPISGLLLGAAMLFRPATSLWLIIIVLALVVALIARLIKKDFPPRCHEAILLFSIGLMIAVAPWWIRNCKVTGEFKPLGNEIQQKIIGSHVYGSSVHGNLNIKEVIAHRESFLINRLELPESPIQKESLVAKVHWDKNASVG